MKADPVTMSLLYDFYGRLLTEKQRDYFEQYYEHDLSLSEIADNEGITRQGVRDAIARAEDTLRGTEKELQLVSRYGRVEMQMDIIAQAARAIRTINDNRYVNTEIQHHADHILALVEGISVGV